jgi:DNA repair photolyase
MSREFVGEPVPHFLVDSKKELHGWYRDERECTSERMLLNPYNGCANDCLYCYAKSYGGYFKDYREEGLVTVFKDFDRAVASQLDSLDVASCGYLSPVTDPFQELEKVYNLSLHLVKVFTDRGLPIEFITKSCVPPAVLELMSHQGHSFGQVSITTVDEGKRGLLMKGGATTDELWEQVRAIRRMGMHAVVRIDPIIPFVTDSFEELRELVKRACDCGASHVVASVMDVPVGMKSSIFEGLGQFGTGTVHNLSKLYSEKIWSSLNAGTPYRKDLFSFLREECDKSGVTFALCMEYELIGGVLVGLNGEFMSSENCEGINIPVYIRDGAYFKPAADCSGNCLSCSSALCGFEELALAREQGTRKSFKLSDYRRWTKQLRRSPRGDGRERGPNLAQRAGYASTEA